MSAQHIQNRGSDAWGAADRHARAEAAEVHRHILSGNAGWEEIVTYRSAPIVNWKFRLYIVMRCIVRHVD